MKKKYTLKSNFEKVMKGTVTRRDSITIFTSPCAPGRGKVGFAVSKKVRGAVKRNRIKRVLREYARHNIMLGRENTILLGSVDLVR